MGLTPKMIPWIILLSLFTAIPLTTSQPNAPPPLSPDADLCNGVFVSYTYSTGSKIKPNDTRNQPYRFESEITVLNNARDELKSWLVFVGFANREILVSATNAVLYDGSSLPASVENGTTFAGYPAADLKSAIMTAGDVTQMQARVKLVGTQFGVAPPNIPLPKNITLANDGWICPKATQRGKKLSQSYGLCINGVWFCFAFPSLIFQDLLKNCCFWAFLALVWSLVANFITKALERVKKNGGTITLISSIWYFNHSLKKSISCTLKVWISLQKQVRLDLKLLRRILHALLFMINQRGMSD